MQNSLLKMSCAVATGLALILSADPASAACKRLGFTVNDYGKDGPTKDAKELLDKHAAKWASEHGITKYTTGKKDVTCELFLNLILFDEHTCTAEATICWDGPAVKGGQEANSSTAPATDGTAEKAKASTKAAKATDGEKAPAASKAAATPEAKTEAKADSKTEAKPEAKPEAKTEAAAEAKSEAKAAAAPAATSAPAETGSTTKAEPAAKASEAEPAAKASESTPAAADKAAAPAQ